MTTILLQNKSGLVDRLLDWLVANSYTITISVLALLALLLVYVALRLFRQSRQAAPSSRAAHSARARRRAAAKKQEVSGWMLRDQGGQSIPVKPLPFSIGRESDNILVLEDISVAAHHARILYDPDWDALLVEDLDSPGGILIEGQPTRKNLLQAGMHLTVGRYQFTIEHQAPRSSP